MTERLIIRNFAGLDNIDIELGRINIFIGPQASGKSVCAKCIYLFKSFLPSIFSSIPLGQDPAAFDTVFTNKFKEYFPVIWKAEGFIIRYEVNGFFIEISNSANLSLKYHELFQETIKGISNRSLDRKNRYLSPKWNDDAEDFLFNKFIDKEKEGLSSYVDNMPYTTQLFIAAGRSFFTALRGSLLSFLVKNPTIDPFLKDFIIKYERARVYQPDIRWPVISELWKLVNHILRGQPLIENEDDFIISPDGRRTTLANSSSGQQEAYAMLLLLMNLMSDEDEVPEHNPHTVYLEEPEAHLFPESQRVLAQLMAIIFHQSPFEIQYVITTHSPYLLSAFNNLIYASQLSDTLRGEISKTKILREIIPLSQQIPLEDFSVYGFEKGGAVSLIDSETGLLSADLLDSASDVTSEQFSALMSLDPSTYAE